MRIVKLVKLLAAAAIPFAVLACTDTAKPDPAADAGAKAATTAASGAAPGASAPSAAAPAKSGGW